jgi:valyl-tRNA synthetase
MAENSLPKTYDFSTTEERIYEWWDKNGLFKPTNDPNHAGFDKQNMPFVISIPPPNVTGELHLGHAMFVSMEDLMIRYHRMKGIPTLWVPGSDHASIATQLQVEKSLAKEGIKREELGREEFIRRAWQWKDKYGGMITRQIRRLGASCDWDRERFTLDPGLSNAVREAFVRLYDKGLIYRGPRLVNWSPGLRTAVSDLEVEYSEEQGTLYYFKYILVPQGEPNMDQSEEYIPVATTRPETILGDSGLAVHPDDPRYQGYIGRRVIVPILGREIPVIADEYVDIEFGTGALKVTPGHDPNDYEIGLQHGLEIISVLDEAARVNSNGGPFAGQDRFEARKNLWEEMRKKGLVIREEPYTISVPRSQRGGEIVEPMVSTQWFVCIQPLAEAALKAVQDGKIRIIPERFTKVYYNWLENIQDWCISRQLWWGHRIPVWYCQDCGKMTVTRHDPSVCAHCYSPRIEQDPDVLDTWFSSGLWPFSTLGWPEQTADLKYFYPTAVLETGYDILFFWVARMIMLGLEFTGEVPFHTVYLHGLVRDEYGRKMSKSYGNVIDPLVIMDELGTDALRFTLLVGSTPGNDMNLSTQKVEANRNFANKIWNAGRFVIGSIENAPRAAQGDPHWTMADSWIWARLQSVIRDVDRLFLSYQFGEAGRQIYEFFWNEFADWYVEVAKLQIAEGGDRQFYTVQTLVKVLDVCLRLLHPFTPFVTEELWGHLKEAAVTHSNQLEPREGWAQALIVARWPEPRMEEKWEAEKVAAFTLVQEVVRSIRNLRAEMDVKPQKKISAVMVSNTRYEIIATEAQTIAHLAQVDIAQLTILRTLDRKPEGYIPLVVGAVEIYLPLAGLVDMSQERRRLEKELDEVKSHIGRLEALLSGSFSEKAPAAVVQKEKDKLAAYQEKADKLSNQLGDIN